MGLGLELGLGLEVTHSCCVLVVSCVSLHAHPPVLTRIMGEPWERTLVRKHAPRLNFVACG